MDELQLLQQLLEELLSGLNKVVQSGEVLSDELKGEIAKELEFLTSRIDVLQASLAPQMPPLQKSMDSSVINAFKFDPKNGNLLVQFKGKYPKDEGSIYSYEGVSPQIFDVFKKGAVPARTKGKNKWGSWWAGKSPSMGSSMNVLLKNMQFPYKKLT